MLTKQQIKDAADKARADLEALGVEIPTDLDYKTSTRMTRGLACYSELHSRIFYYGTDYSAISVNMIKQKLYTVKRMIKVSIDVPVEQLPDIIMHELIHAVNYYEYNKTGRKGNKPGHGKKFMNLVMQVNTLYPDKYHVTEKASLLASLATTSNRVARRYSKQAGNGSYINQISTIGGK